MLSSQMLLEIVFLTIVFSHITRKNFGAVLAYSMQSLAIAMVIFNSFLLTGATSLLFIASLVLLVKVIMVPFFLARLIQRHEIKFSVSTYLNVPLTLISIAGLVAVAHSRKFAPLTSIVPANQLLLSLALSAMLLSFFLIINRKGAISQIIGILSLENSIVAFAIFAGLEQSFSLQVGIVSDVFIWFIIATALAFMIYKHFGSLEVTSMKQLKD